VFVFGEWSCACSAEFLHVGTNAEDFSDVVAEFAYVGSPLAAYFEENVAPVFFQEIYIVDSSCSQLPFD